MPTSTARSKAARTGSSKRICIPKVLVRQEIEGRSTSAVPTTALRICLVKSCTGYRKQDFIDLGYPLEFDENGELRLNGDTGISAGVKDELATLIGKTRIIPIYTAVSGNGNNAMFTIVRWEGVRILDVKLTGKGSGKRVMIQPAKVLARGTKIDYTGTHTSSHLVSPVMLVE